MCEEKQELAAVVNIFIDPETQELQGRQLALLKRVVRDYEQGFRLRELEVVSELIGVVHAKCLDGGDIVLEQTLSCLIRLCGRPPLRDKANEEVMEDGVAAATKSIERLVWLVSSPLPRLAIEAVRCLRSLALDTSRPSSKDLHRTLLLRTEAIEAAKIALWSRVTSSQRTRHGQTVECAQLLIDLQESDDEGNEKKGVVVQEKPSTAEQGMIREALELLRELTSTSKGTARFIRHGSKDEAPSGIDILATTLSILLDDDATSELVVTAIQVAWNTLEKCGDTAVPICSREQLAATLLKLLTILLRRGNRSSDKQLRNEVLIVVSLTVLPEGKKSQHHASPQLFELLVAYAMAAETSIDDHFALKNEWQHSLGDRGKLFATAEDLELKRLLWAVLSELSRRDEACLNLLVDAGFLGKLLAYLEKSGVPGKAYKEHRLSAINLEVLQQQAMAVLLNLAPRAADAFRQKQGQVIALQFLDSLHLTTMESEEMSLGRRATLDQLAQSALRLLQSVVGLPGLQDELGDLDGIRIMLRRFCAQDASAGLRTDAVQILARLCENHSENQASFRRLGGVPALIDEIEKYCANRVPPEPIKLSTGELVSSTAAEKVSPLLASVVDCLWKAIVGNRRSEARLASARGVEVLLTLLEVGPKLSRHQCCGVLSDLMLNTKLTTPLLTWKSDHTMRTALELLAAIWRDEEIRLGFDRPDGTLTNIHKPLRWQHDAVEFDTALVSQSGARCEDDELLDDDSDLSSIATDAFAHETVNKGKRADELSRPHSIQSKREEPEILSLPQDEVSFVSGTEEPRPRRDTTISLVSKTSAQTKFAQKSHGGTMQASESARAQAALRAVVNECDVRGVVAGIIKVLPVPEDLPAEDRAALAMGYQWSAFREGEAWAQVKDLLRAAAIKPIAADCTLIQKRLDCCRDLAIATQDKQRHLASLRQNQLLDEEHAFFSNIIFQRDQEIKQLAIKRQSIVPKSIQIKRRELLLK